MDEQIPARPTRGTDEQENSSWLVRVTENKTIAPRCRQIFSGRLETGQTLKHPPLVCVDPAQVPIEGIFIARGLSRVRPRADETSRVMSKDDHSGVRARNSCALVMMVNFSEEPLTIPKATFLGVAEEISENLVDRINQGDVEATHSRVGVRKNRALYNKLLEE